MAEAGAHRPRRRPRADDGSQPQHRRERQSAQLQDLEPSRLQSAAEERSQPDRPAPVSLRCWGRFDNLPLSPDSTLGATSEQAVHDALLARYRERGESFLDGLTGAFAVALSDDERDLTAIACDGMGNRYLAYSLADGRLACSPRPNDLACETSSSRRLPSVRLAEYFAYEELSGSETFFDSVRSLLPGEMLVLEAGRLRRRRLTRPRPDARIERGTWEEYVEEFAHLLDASVGRCLRGVDRVAVLMSGGLDSTPIAALAARHLASRGASAAVSALSWRLSDRRGDESGLIRRVAEQVGLEVEWIECDDATPFSRLDEWPVHPATPEQTSFRWFHQRSYARAAARGHSVLLAGFCGDALYVHGRRWAWDLLSAEGPGRAIDRLREVAAQIGWRRTLRTQVFAPLLPRSRGLRRELPGYLTAAARQLLAARASWPHDVETARRPRQAERLLALLDAHGAEVERHYTEPFGLEQRTPLRDHALVQFMVSVPDHLLQQGSETRPVLRSAVVGLIPEEVRQRRDKGAFHDVHERGMATGRLRWTRRLLLDPDALWRGYIEEAAVRSWVDSSPTDGWGKLGYLQAIFGELWRRERAGLPRLSADALD